VPPPIVSCSGGQQAYCGCPAGAPTRGGGGEDVIQDEETDAVAWDESEVTYSSADPDLAASKRKKD